MQRKLLITLLVLIGGFSFVFPQLTLATTEHDIVVIYSIDDDQQVSQVRMLDAILGQLNINYAIFKDNEVKSSDIEAADKIVYYGISREDIPKETISALKTFEGNIFAISHNFEQLNFRLNWFEIDGEVLVNQIELPDKKSYEIPEDRIIYNINTFDGSRVHASHSDNNDLVPIITEHEGDFYFSAQFLFQPFDGALTESLREFLDLDDKSLKRYLRLEDIHPRVNADQLREQADYLISKDIPYMIAVIPVYTHQGETVHLSDSPKLVKALKYMQDNGASIVLHGYKHQYRASETGEGFEFWDVDNDRPIYQPADVEAKTQKDFASDQEYNKFLENGKAFERTYIKNAISTGIEELVAHGLYPLAFEPPHYAISQQGYEVIAEHFTSYIGRLQLADHTWQTEFAPLYESKPTFLHGMTIYPETVGFIDDDHEQSMKRLKENVRQKEKYSQSYISAFYHPYLGIEGLKDVVDTLESVKNAEWFDLKEKDNIVDTRGIQITTENGEIEIVKSFISSNYERNLFVKKVLLWSVPILIAVAAIVIVLVRSRKNKN